MKKSKLTKKVLSFALALIMMLGIVPAVLVYADNAINVTIDGVVVVFSDQHPVNIDGRILVPVRGVFEAMGFEVEWDEDTNTAIITNANYEMRITINNNVFTTNGINHTLDVPAQIIGGRTMVPIRLPLESVGYALNWDGVTNTVLISTDGTVPVVATPKPWSNEPNWSGRDIIVRVNGEVADIPFRSITSILFLSIGPVLNALNLPENHVQFIQNAEGEYALASGNPAQVLSGVSFSSRPYDLRQHIMAELLNVDIVFDMYYRTIDITSNSQSGGLSRVLPVQYIPRYGWVRMTNEMLRDVERLIGETVVNQIAEEGITVVFCPYLSAGNRRFAYDYVNRPYLSLFTHTHRAGTGSNYLARRFYGSLYRPGIISQQGTMPSRGTYSLGMHLFYQAESGLLAPDWTRTSAFRYLDTARAETQELLANPLHTDPYRFLGIGRHFCERTGNFYNGNFQVGQFWWRTVTEQDAIVGHYRLYTFIVNGYEVIYRDWYGDRVEEGRSRIGQDWILYQTGCPYLNGFATMERQMLD